MPDVKATLDILLPLPLAESFEYRAATPVPPGQLAQASFGKRQITGLVLGAGRGEVSGGKLKDLGPVLPLPPLPGTTLNFLRWASHYIMTPPGLLLKMLLAGVNPPPEPQGLPFWRGTGTGNRKLKPGAAPQRLLDLAATRAELDSELLAAHDIPLSAAAALVRQGLLTKHYAPPLPPRLQPDFHQPRLTEAQRQAAAILQGSFADPRPILLQGVTGSGKTEVYCEAIAACLRAGKQALVLMPEIALTTAMVARFTQRFGASPVLWHSDVPESRRRAAWWQIARGQAQLIIGARSALFLPYPALGLIVVDEEHEAAYKQEDGVLYHARDMAVARAHHEKIPVILASATPSLESHVNAEQGRYRRVRLPERFGGAKLPLIHRIDMRAEQLPATRFISAPLLAALQETLAASEQAMLFLNRRGYAPLTLCRACGHRLQCPQCSAWLVQHKYSKKLQCHHCGTQSLMPQHCPACRTDDKFAACGPGVERVAEEAAALLPQARIAIMASDLLHSPQAIADLLARVHARDIDLLIGTQIMAKGYHFPDMTLVGIIDADLGLSGGDPRASERCYQLLQQVAGRTGRAQKPGRAYLQTYQPEHPVMQALANNDHAAFMQAELQERRVYDLPPFKRLAALTVSGPDAGAAQKLAAQLAAAAPQEPGLRILGPAPAPLAMLRGQYRFRLLAVADKTLSLQQHIETWRRRVSLPKTLKLQIDIDPYSFF